MNKTLNHWILNIIIIFIAVFLLVVLIALFGILIVIGEILQWEFVLLEYRLPQSNQFTSSLSTNSWSFLTNITSFCAILDFAWSINITVVLQEQILYLRYILFLPYPWPLPNPSPSSTASVEKWSMLVADKFQILPNTINAFWLSGQSSCQDARIFPNESK